MSEYQKIFIGNGKQVKNFDMVECSVEYDQLVPFEYNGKRYVKFTVAARRDGADKWGKTHSVSISKRSEGVAQASAPAQTPSAPAYPQEEINPEDIPF